MSDKIEIWELEYELRQAIDLAVRWSFDSVNQYRTEQNPYSVFDYFIINERTYFELFRTQLNRKLTETKNWKAIGIDLNNKFLKGINQYINWYKENKIEVEKFQPKCPYTELLSIVESTKNEILQYFPEYDKASLPQPIDTDHNRTKKVIVEQLELLDNKGWEYAFRTENDYNAFADLLTNFFEFQEYKLPKQSIQLKRGCKTRLAATLGKIHSELSNSDTLLGDTEFFDIVRALNHFESLTTEQLYKDLSRFGKY